MRQETYEIVATVLEDFAGREVEETAEAIVYALASRGEDLLEHLDPPVGLQRWLESHGLSLVETMQVAAPRVWDAIEEDEESAPEPSLSPQSPIPQVGDRVRYRTAPAGPRNEMLMGGGTVSAVKTIASGHIIVSVTAQDHMRPIHLSPGDGDLIEIVGAP
jgi:hypothetical protein